MAYGFDDFKNYLKFRLGNRDDLESFGDGSENLYGVLVNAAYKELVTKNRFWGLNLNFEFPRLYTSGAVSTVDGTAYVALPSDCLTPMHVEDTTSDYILKYDEWEWYLNRKDRTDTDKEDEPKYWAWMGERIYLYPTPDAVYDLYVWYNKVPAALTGTDTTAIGEEWDQALLELACYKGFRWMHEYEKAASHQEEFLRLLTDTIGGTNKRRHAARRRVKLASIFTSSLRR